MKQLFPQILSYIPGVFILAFGMLAIYASADVINVYDEAYALSAKDSGLTSESWRAKQNLLYWSVIAISFFGFVLAILNAQRLYELKKLNNEKKVALNDMENRLAALEAAREGMLILSAEKTVIYANPALCKIFGLDPDQRKNIFNQPWEILFSESDFEIIQEDIIPDLDRQGFWLGEFPIYHDDNTVLDTEISMTRLPDGGIIGTIQDITEKKKIEEEKGILENQFHQAQKMEAIGRLAGGIAHDFNNILASMNGYAEFLIDDLDKKTDQHQFAKNILQAGLQARELVDQMLAFSRRADSTAETLDLVSSLKETLSMLHATLPKAVELYDNFHVKSAYINGNATQISQLLMNLCVNAQDAMENGNGKLMVTLEETLSGDVPVEKHMIQDHFPDPHAVPFLHIEECEPGASQLYLGHLKEEQAYVKLRIEDTGCGMSRSVMEHIFEPFFTTKPVDKGTGLGLATVHGVVTSHYGFMTILSRIGQGTAFDLYFPLVKSEAKDVPLPETSSNSVSKGKGKSKRILLVEDQEEVRVMMLKMLDRLGYDALCASSGRDGLEVVREDPKKFDLVITDQNMPEMSGLEMIQSLHREYPNIPFIMLSGYSENKMQSIIDKHPAIKSILKKPVSKNVLAQHIEEILAAVA